MENGWSEEKSDKGGESKGFPSLEAIEPIKESRSSNNDLIICCSNKKASDEDETIIKRFGVEKAVLACHSVFFENAFDTCDNSNEKSEVPLPEQADVVQTFLNCIYGVDTEVWTFDRCIDVIEMARNYEARVVERQAYLRLCAAFETLSTMKDKQSTHTRYEATFLEKSFREKSSAIITACGMEAASDLKSNRSTGTNCNYCRNSNGGYVNPDRISGSSFAINKLFKEEECKHFSINELLEFKLCLILYATSPPSSNIYDSFMKESFQYCT